tara:strand:- start:77 stop:1408 length:1332 start_codon:yes stop_codon:yes gene_type:complete
MLYSKTTPTIRDFRDDLYHITDCQPVGQRLPVYSKDNAKSIGIITTLLDGYDIGTITLMKLNKFVKFQYESIDGGHRKRALWSYLQNEFEVNGKCFSQLSEKEQDTFLDTKLSFTVYNALDSATKGHVFRTLNKTTDVNFIEMLNSYGDIPVANFIRETVRTVKQIDNECNTLFEFTLNVKGEPKYTYLSFDNDRLKQDQAFARIAHRYIQHPKQLLGGSSDTELEAMYEDSELEMKDIPVAKIKAHLDFLRKVAMYRKQQFKTGLTQHDFKALSYLYFYLSDTYGAFTIPDAEEFFKAYARANSLLMNKDGDYAEVIHEPSGYSVQVMYKKYIAAPWQSKKISTAISYLVGEMGDIEDIIETRDNNRSFTVNEKEAKLAEQNFVCAVDGKNLKWNDAHAAHIIAHANGGRTIYSNLAMVRACYNTEMGTMNLNEYKNCVYDR